jgi:hypothetical protein
LEEVEPCAKCGKKPELYRDEEYHRDLFGCPDCDENKNRVLVRNKIGLAEIKEWNMVQKLATKKLEILPCPICGSTDIQIMDDDADCGLSYKAYCNNCRKKEQEWGPDWCAYPESAINDWNVWVDTTNKYGDVRLTSDEFNTLAVKLLNNIPPDTECEDCQRILEILHRHGKFHPQSMQEYPQNKGEQDA